MSFGFNFTTFWKCPFVKSETSKCHFLLGLYLSLIFHFWNSCVFYTVIWPLQAHRFVINGEFGRLLFLYIGVLIRFANKIPTFENTLWLALQIQYLPNATCVQNCPWCWRSRWRKKICPRGQKFWWKPTDNLIFLRKEEKENTHCGWLWFF